MKRILSLALCFMMILGTFIGCGKDDSYDYERYSPKPTNSQLEAQPYPEKQATQNTQSTQATQNTQAPQEWSPTVMKPVDLDRLYAPDEDYIKKLLMSEWWILLKEADSVMAICFKEDGKIGSATRALLGFEKTWELSGRELKMITALGSSVISTTYWDICEEDGIVYLAAREEDVAYVRESDWKTVTDKQVNIGATDQGQATGKPADVSETEHNQETSKPVDIPETEPHQDADGQLDFDRFYKPDEDYIKKLLMSEWWVLVSDADSVSALRFKEDGKVDSATRALIGQGERTWALNGRELKIEIGRRYGITSTIYYDICEEDGVVYLNARGSDTLYVRESDWTAVADKKESKPTTDHTQPTAKPVEIPETDYTQSTESAEEVAPGAVCKTCGDKGICPSCGGNKWCKTCKGNGFLCPFCDRDGTEGKCRVCYGETRLKCGWCDGDWKCENCKASGDCRHCDGSGECYKCNGSLKINCRRCDASGDCFLCDGKGTKGGRKCSTCKGSGDCYECGGSKKMECIYCDAHPKKCLQCLGDGDCNECGGDGSVCLWCANGYNPCVYCDEYPGKCSYCKGEYLCKDCDGEGELCKECTNGKCPDCGGKNTGTNSGGNQDSGNTGSKPGSSTGSGGGNCLICGGYGVCKSCIGSGSCSNYGCIYGKVPCSKCEGGGRCKSCGGLGENFLTGKKCTAGYCDDGDCSACDGNGEVKCSTCGGDGFCTAKYCDDGWCTYCGGDGDY